MDKAILRINEAIEKNQKILIYGDYDVDGTTAVATVFSFLVERYPNVDFYIPDRYTEGYGISFMSIDWARNNSFSLIKVIDCDNSFAVTAILISGLGCGCVCFLVKPPKGLAIKI
jgi:single-stranded-DNA-specific exonuclease